MIYLLDTSVAVEILCARDREILERFAALMDDCALCEVVTAELVFGYTKVPDAKRERNTLDFIGKLRILPFGFAGAQAYARTRSDLERDGRVISGNDLLIAATALAHGATLVTRNVGEFARVAGLAVESWTS